MIKKYTRETVLIGPERPTKAMRQALWIVPKKGLSAELGVKSCLLLGACH